MRENAGAEGREEAVERDHTRKGEGLSTQSIRLALQI